jgi:hypothetical protein
LIVRFSAKLSRLDCDWNAASRSILNDGTSGPSAERVGGSANDLFLRPSRFSVTATTAIEQRFRAEEIRVLAERSVYAETKRMLKTIVAD